MTCPGFGDASKYAHTEFTGCDQFDVLYPGPPIQPPSPPGVPPPPPVFRYLVTTHVGCADFDDLYPGPPIVPPGPPPPPGSPPVFRYRVVISASAGCPDSSICCGCYCCRCNGYWTQFTFSVSGMSGPGNCADANGDYTLTGGTGCLWTNGPGIPP
jgi:hypothetical protein